jgi:hypothetical protein
MYLDYFVSAFPGRSPARRWTDAAHSNPDHGIDAGAVYFHDLWEVSASHNSDQERQPPTRINSGEVALGRCAKERKP